MEYHIPVMLKESVEGLDIKRDGLYVDVTFGGGGHSKEIIKQLGDKGRLVGFDRDETAIKNRIDDSRFLFIKSNYRFLKKQLKLNGITEVDGIIADLGVSSHQFDVAERGFSIRFDGPLDMRMDRSASLTAADVVNTYKEAALCDVFHFFGEVRNARRLAAHIVAVREQKPINTTNELSAAINTLIAGNRNKYLAQVFQALRIEVNNELESLKQFLIQSYEMLKVGGRLVVLTYHSLEDRLVKNFIKKGVFAGEAEKDMYGHLITKHFNEITRKPIVSEAKEIASNSRARSAKLRIAAKL